MRELIRAIACGIGKSLGAECSLYAKVSPVTDLLRISRSEFLAEMTKVGISPIDLGTPLDSIMTITTKVELERIAPYLVYPADWYITELWDCQVEPEVAFGMGLFYADGSCGLRSPASYAGANWVIVNWKLPALERIQVAFEREWPEMTFPIKLYDYYKSGNVTNYGKRQKDCYCLEVSPKHRTNNGDRGRFVERFRESTYYSSGEKKVPSGVLESPLASKRSFLEGVIEGDGTGLKTKQIAVHGNTSLTALVKLMSDVRWQYITRIDNGDDNYCLSVNRRQEGKGKLLEYLDGKDWVSHTELYQSTGVNYCSCHKWLKELENEGLVELEHPWDKRTNAKLIAPYNFCEDYALQAQCDAAFKFHVSGIRMGLGQMPLGYHGFPITLSKEGNIWLIEPNAGFPYAGEWFKIGEHSYLPRKVFA